MVDNIPNPGSDEAIKLGCTCPVMDNWHGEKNDGLFWYTSDCPVHFPTNGEYGRYCRIKEVGDD